MSIQIVNKPLAFIKPNNLISIFLISVFTGCSPDIKEQPRPQGQPEQKLENFSTFEISNGKKNWKLVAAEAKIFETQNKVEIRDFTVNFFTKDGKTVKARLTAIKGRIDTTKNDFYTEGKSLIETAEGEILKTSDLVYRNDKGMIYSDTDVTLTRKDAVITGRGLEATPDLSTIIIKQNLVELKK